MLKPWFERHPEFLEQEKAALAELGFTLDEQRLAKESLVIFEGRSKHDPQRKLTVVYPTGYPSFPPTVHDDGSRPLLSRHHHPQTREFCLFGPAGNRYSSSEKWGPDAIAEAEELIAGFPSETAPALANEIAEPVSALLPTPRLGGFLVPPPVASLGVTAGAPTVVGSCALLVATESDKSKRGIVVEVDVDGQKLTAIPPFSSIPGGTRRTARLVRLGQTPPAFTSESGVGTWLRFAGLDRAKIFTSIWLVFVYPEESGTALASSVAWTVMHVDRTSTQCFRGFPVRDEERLARVPGFGRLATKSVAMFGLGSIGSRIATCLAASGVRKFMLIDREIFEPSNAVRHELGVSAFGLWKSQAIGRRLFEANPACIDHLRWSNCRIGAGTRKEETELLQHIATSDLVVNATGSEHASHWLNGVCLELKKPCVHASVTNGAWGGEAIRVLPGGSACWVCQQLANPMPVAESATDVMYAPGCAQPTFTGSMPEVSVIAEIAATLCIETLVAREGRDLNGSHVQWHARSGTGAFGPKVEVHLPKPRPTCFFCAPQQRSPATSS